MLPVKFPGVGCATPAQPELSRKVFFMSIAVTFFLRSLFLLPRYETGWQQKKKTPAVPLVHLLELES